MSRRHAAEKREVLPDAKFGSLVVTKFMNTMMYNGKKSVAEQIVYEALKTVEAKTGKPALEVLESAVKTVTPVLEVKGRRVGGANYQVPVEVPQRRARTLAVRWLVTFARERREKGMSVKLACNRRSLDAWWRAVSTRNAGLLRAAHVTVCEVLK